MILWNKVVQIFELCSLRSVYSWAIIKMQGQGYHVVGHGNLFYIGHIKGNLFYPRQASPRCPYSMVILMQYVPKNPVFMRGKG